MEPAGGDWEFLIGRPNSASAILDDMYAFERQCDWRKPRPDFIKTLESRMFRHPSRFIHMQIIWIASFLVWLVAGLLWAAKGLKTGDAHDLATGFVGIVAGVAGVFAGFLRVNWAMKRLESKIAPHPEPDDVVQLPSSSLDRL